MPISPISKAPFPEIAALSPASSQSLDCVPGQPDVSLGQDDVSLFLAQDLETPILDELYPNLWLVARKSGANIDPLHQQKAKGREITLLENPQLHLVWLHNKVYIKPLPEYLLNHYFWATCLSPDSEIPSNADLSPNKRLTALGFVRSYAHLIKYRSDFALAQELHLIPDSIEWAAWCRFIQYFRNYNDNQVAKRYHYGQLRLSRLNWAVRLFQPPSANAVWFYQVPYWSIQTFLRHITAPLIFGFAIISVVLSSMQVLLSASTDNPELGLLSVSQNQLLRQACWAYSISMLILSALISTLLFVVPVTVLIWQISWGFRKRGKQVAMFTLGL
ncbi:hypothetical protein BDW60DRAFT_222174 [Aspergillus nidulans var. acristatus]